jgi:tetratricopeptide (TPR) repeat protein
MDLIGDARGATISLVLGLFLALGVYYSYSRKIFYKWTGRVLAAGIILATVTAVVMVVIPNNRIHNSFAKDTQGARFLYWNIAVQSIHNHPLIGTGPETYRYQSERLFNPEILRKTYGGEIWADKPHNAYLETLVTSGILGGTAYLMMIIMVILGLVRLAKKPENQVSAAVISGFLLAYLLNNFILFDIAVSYLIFFIVLFWVARTELESRNSNFESELDKKSKLKTSWFIIRSVTACCVIAITLGIVVPELGKMKLVLNEMYAPLQTRAGMYQKSEASSPFGSGLSFAERADVYSQNYQRNIATILKSSPESQRLVLADIDSLISELETMMQQYPITTQGLVALGRLASERIAVAGTLDENSLKELTFAGDRILAISPTNMQGYWFLGQVAVYKQDYKTALDDFNKAIAIDPKIPESHLAVINLAQLSGNTALYNQAVRDYQNDVIPEDRK